MWTAFVFFGSVGHVYFIEGDDIAECSSILKSSFSKEAKIEVGVSDIFHNEYLTQLLGDFNITEDAFINPSKDIKFYKKGKDDIPRTLRLIDGEYCKICKQFCHMSISNQEDGTLICWSCRDTNKWMLQ